MKTLIECEAAWKDFIASVVCDAIGDVHPLVSIEKINDATWKVNLGFRLDSDTAQSDWQVRLHPAFMPDFFWAPHLAPEKDYIIDQHTFRSPALIAGSRERLIILIPDLDIMGEGTPVRWYLDLDAQANTLALGMSNSTVAEHVLFKKAPGAKYPKGTTYIGFYLMLFNSGNMPINPWRPALDFLWQKWGKALYHAGEPLDHSLDKYLEHTYKWAFDSWKEAVWQEFELNGKKVGAPVFIVNITQSPNYPGEVNEREMRSIWNQAWFSSLRSASGLFRFARRTGNSELMQRALMAKELALSAPQNDGLFPSVIATEMEVVQKGSMSYFRSKGWKTHYWGNSNRNPITRDIKESPLHILDMSWTALLMLRWYDELERDERLMSYALAYADALLKLQDAKGFFPAWLDKDTREPLGVLDDSPETSMSVTFLLKAYEISGKNEYKEAALKALEAVTAEIVPTGRWEDFETYWSCCPYGNDPKEGLIGRKVERNGMYKQCNFSIFWTAEALYEAYRLTGSRDYLSLGRRCLDELLMTQASWQPPYMYVNTLGGFGVMNCDGEWNDSRQSLFAELIIQYGIALEEAEYIERGLAALKCSFVMMYCPENRKTKAQWEERWPFFNCADYGFMMENYGHDGVTGSNGMGIGEFTIFDWGNGAACEALMRLSDHYSDFSGFGSPALTSTLLPSIKKP